MKQDREKKRHVSLQHYLAVLGLFLGRESWSSGEDPINPGGPAIGPPSTTTLSSRTCVFDGAAPSPSPCLATGTHLCPFLSLSGRAKVFRHCKHLNLSFSSKCLAIIWRAYDLASKFALPLPLPQVSVPFFFGNGHAEMLVGLFPTSLCAWK